MPITPVNDHYSGPSGGVIAGGRFVAPDWAPVAGEIKTISKAAGFFGANGGATVAEINPAYQAWNPQAPSQGPYKGTEYFWGTIHGYSGICWDSDNRRLVNYGAGHASINVCAPFCFDLNDLRWKWLDTPLPFDGYGRISTAGVSATFENVAAYYPGNAVDLLWGEINGDSPLWENEWGVGPWLRPGKIFPIPGHTRNVLAHIPASVIGNSKGALFKFGSSSGMLSGTVGSNGCSHLFDYDTATWRRTQNPQPSFATNASSTAQSTLVDSQTKTVIHWGGGTPFKVFDIPTETWRPLRYAANSIKGSGDIGNVVNYLPARLLIGAFARDAAGEQAFDAAGRTFVFAAVAIDDIVGSGTFSVTQLTVNVSSWPLNAAGHNRSIGFSYCPADKCLYTVNGDTNSTKYWKLAPPPGAVTQSDYLTGTWTLTEHAFSSGVLSSPSARSWIYNRLSWDKNSRSFLWFPDAVSGPVQAFRPHGV